MTREPATGDLVVYRTLSGAEVARVDLVREGHVSAFPWRQADRRYDRRRFRVFRRDLVKVLGPDVDPAPIADELNALTNRRAAERMKANRVFDQRVDRLLASVRSVD